MELAFGGGTESRELIFGGGTGARELAIVTGELGRKFCVRSALGREVVRCVVDAKGEVAVGEGWGQRP